MLAAVPVSLAELPVALFCPSFARFCPSCHCGAEAEDARVCDEVQRAFNADESGDVGEDFELDNGY